MRLDNNAARYTRGRPLGKGRGEGDWVQLVGTLAPTSCPYPALGTSASIREGDKYPESKMGPLVILRIAGSILAIFRDFGTPPILVDFFGKMAEKFARLFGTPVFLIIQTIFNQKGRVLRPFLLTLLPNENSSFYL